MGAASCVAEHCIQQTAGARHQVSVLLLAVAVLALDNCMYVLPPNYASSKSLPVLHKQAQPCFVS